MADRKISVALTVDGTAAQRGYAEAARFALEYGASSAAALGQATQAAMAYTASVKQTTLAHQAQESAGQRFLSALERENAMLGKTRDQQLELRAAMLGVSQAAEPLIQRWREVTAAAQAASAAEKNAADGAAFVASLNARANAIGKTSAQLLEMKAAELGVTAQAAPLIARLKESEANFGRVGASAGQTSQAMRMLPAQFSDLFTQIASGQGVFLPFLQQGLQTRDMFGSFAAMFAGIGAALTPMVVGLGAAAAALGAVGYAFVTGSQQTDALRNAVIATGHAAGMSAGQMQELAAQVGRATGEYGTAREAAQELAATGRLSGRQIEVALGGVVAGTKVTGQAVTDLVADFVKLGDAPSKAIAELNEKYHFLTARTFEQIAALEQQGKTTEAATLAQQAYADALQSRSGEIVENIGLFARAWRLAKKDAGEAWDAFLNIGRPKTLADEIREQIDTVNDFQKAYANAKALGNGVLAGTTLTSLRDARAHLMALQERSAKEYTEGRSKEEKALAEQRSIDAQRRLGQLDLQIDKAKALSAELRKNKADEAAIRATNPDSDFITPAAIAAREAETRKKYEDKSASAAGQNAINGRLAALRTQQQAEESALKASLDEQKKLRETGVTDLQQFYDNEYTLRASSLARQLGIAQKEVEAASGKNELAAREQAKGRVAKIQQEIEQNEAQHQANVQGIRDQFAADIGQQVVQWEEQKQAAAAALNSENSLYGKTDAQRRIAAAGLKVEADARKLRDAEAKKGITLTEEEIALLDEKTAAAARDARQAEANMLAAHGAQQLYEENQRFAADAILDERAHAEALVEIERQKWQALIDAATDGSDQKRKLVEGLATWEANQAARPQIEAQRRARQQTITDWSRTIDNVNDTFREGFADMVNGGVGTWKAFTKSLSTTFKTTVVDSMYQAFAKPMVVSVLANVAGMITGNSSIKNGILDANGGGSSWLNGLTSANNYGQAAMQAYGGYSTGASTASMAYANGVQAMGGDGLGALIAGNGNWAGVGAGAALGGSAAATGFAGLAGANAAGAASMTALGTGAFGTGTLGAAGISGLGSVTGATIGTTVGSGLTATGMGAAVGGAGAGAGAAGAGTLASTMSGAMSAIGTAMPYIGAALAAYALLSGSFKGEKRSGGTFAWAGGNAQFMHGPSGGTAGQEGTVNAAISATASSINGLLKGVGSTLSVNSLIAAFEGSEKGRGGVMSGVTLSNGLKVGEDGSGSNYKGTYYERNSPQTLTAEAAAGLLTTDLKQLQIQALQAADDIPNALRKLVDGIDAESLSDDTVTNLLAKVQLQVTGVTQFSAFVDGLEGPFDKLKTWTYDLKAGLVEAAGGAEPLIANLTSYYENFTPEADRMANTFAAMSKTAASVGQVLPTTAEGFKTLVDGLRDGLSETDTEGQKALATLLSLNGTFKQWSDYTVAQSEATAVKNKQNADKQKADVVAAFEAQLAAVQKAAQRASALLSTRNAAGSTVDSIDKALGGTGAFAARREQELWAAMQTASLEQQVDLAGELTSLVLDRYQTEKSNLQSLVELGKSLREYVQGLKVSDLSPLTLGEKLAEAGKQYQEKLAKAQGGDQQALQELQAVAQTYLELQRRYSASGVDYTAVFDSVTGALDGLGVKTQTTAQQQLDVGGESLDQLQRLRGIADGAWTTLDKQYQQAVAASQSEMAGLEKIALKAGRLDDVASLLAGLPGEIAAQLQPLLNTSSQVQGWYQGNLGRDADAGGLEFWSNAAANGATEQQFQAVAAREQALVAAYKKLLGRVPDAAGREFWLSTGLDASQFEKEIGKAAGIPGYARGGLTGTGLILVGEKGPELLDMPTPGRVYTNDQLSSAIRGGSSSNNTARLERLVEGLTAEVIDLRAALVKATGESAERVAATVAAGAEHVATTVEQSVNEGAFAASQRKVEIA
jgi:hypothetical protein